MKNSLSQRERLVAQQEVMRQIHLRGPAWTESIIRPLPAGNTDAVWNLTDQQLIAIMRSFGGVIRPRPGVVVL